MTSVNVVDGNYTAESTSSNNPNDGWETYMTAHPATDAKWVKAFNMNVNGIYEGAWIGMNGQGDFNGSSAEAQAWQSWRQYFWHAIGNQYLVQDALTYADLHLSSGAPEPNPRSWSPTLNVPKRVSHGDWQW